MIKNQTLSFIPPLLDSALTQHACTLPPSAATLSLTNRFISLNGDDNGIPCVSHGHGKNGIALLIAAEAAIDLSKNSHAIAFDAIKGGTHNPHHFTKVRRNYQPAENSELILSLHNLNARNHINRNPMLRSDGTTISLPDALPLIQGSGTQLNLSGQQIYEANCSICHGQHGEGVDGKALGYWQSTGILATIMVRALR